MPFPAANAERRRFDARGFARLLDDFAQRQWRWLVLLAWLLICAGYLNAYAASIHWFALNDTDDNMRYLQVHDWLAGQGWWDLTQHRMNPPQGANIHWSRLVDLPIAALMLLFRLFMSPDGADRLAVGVAPLLPLLPLMLALAFIARRLAAQRGGGHGWFAAMLLPMGALMGLGMFMPERIDHHGWQLALTAMTLAGLVDRKWVRGGIVAGVSSAASVAIGMEMMIYLAAAGGLIALRWIFKDGAARRLQPYALSLGATTALGYAGFASNANRLPVCDALSPVWTSILILSAGVLLAISLLPLRSWPQRLIAAALGGVVIAGFAWLSWPHCLTGAYQLDPELERSWLSYIREAKSILRQPQDKWVPMAAMPVAGLLCALVGCWSARRDPERLWAWGTVTLMIAFALGLMFWQIRAGPAAQLLAIPPLGWALWALAKRLFTGRGLARVAAVFGLLGLGSVVGAYPLYPLADRAIVALRADVMPPDGPVAPDNALANAATNGTPNYGTPTHGAATEAAASARTESGLGAPAAPNRSAIPSDPSRANARCRTVPALAPLDQLPPAVIFTMVDMGPRILAVTHHSVIAGPYHRNGKAILDIHHAFDGSPERFRAIAAAHQARYLLFCPGFPEGGIYQRRSPNGVYGRLMKGERFDFLEPVTLKFNGRLPYQLYRIVPETTAP